MVSRKTVNMLLAGAFILVGFTGVAKAEDVGTDQEKCYGVAKADAATKDDDGSAWIALPKGVCEKLMDGSLAPVATAAPVTEETPAVDPEAAADEEEHHQH